jgi:hypothetical protein
LYFADSHDKSPFDLLPAQHWQAGAKANNLRLHIWEYDGLNSKGAAHALERFNIGRQTSVDQLSPGDLFKLNRSEDIVSLSSCDPKHRRGSLCVLDPGGHSAIFIAFIDKDGRVLERYSQEAKGVLYFTSQGTDGVDLNGKPSKGMGFRKEWFLGNCPNYDVRAAHHCQMYPSTSLFRPNVGYMLHPKRWTEEIGSNYRKELSHQLFIAHSGQPEFEAFASFYAGPDIDHERAMFDQEIENEYSRPVDPEAMGHFVND